VRTLYATLCGLSAALFLVLVIHLCVHSPAGHVIEWRGQHQRWWLATEGYPLPRLWLHRSSGWPRGDTTSEAAIYSESGVRRESQYAGVKVVRGTANIRRKGLSNIGVEYLDVRVPALLLLLLTAVLPTAYVVTWTYRRRRSAKRLAAGCCVTCGYDLRGSGVVCPECGRKSKRDVLGKHNGDMLAASGQATGKGTGR
jgi:hypothetical protein